MKRYLLAGVCAGLLCLLAACAPAPLPEPPPAPAYDALTSELEQQAVAELAAIDPEAVPIYRAAAEAYFRDGDTDAAGAGLGQVLARVPEFHHALRLLSYIAHYLDDDAAAVNFAERAVAAKDTGQNHSELAWAYIYLNTEQGYLDAYTEVHKALVTLPDDAETLIAWFYSADQTGNTAEAREAATRLMAVAPWSRRAYLIMGVVNVHDGQYEAAELELDMAERLGLDAKLLAEVRSEGDVARQAFTIRWLRRGGYFLAGWAGLFMALAAGGTLLNGLTQAGVRTALQTGQLPENRRERGRRRAYRALLTGAAAYFYLTVVITLLAVVGAGAGFAYLYQGNALNQMPVLQGFLMVGVLLSLAVSLAIGLWVWAKPHAVWGTPVTRADAPGLWALADEVARRLETRPVTAIYAGPTAELVVLEGGRLWQRLRNTGPRHLIVGLGLLPGLTQGQLRALLAHEYALLDDHAGAGGRLYKQMRLALGALTNRLAQSGRFTRRNLVWLYVSGFRRWFLDLGRGAMQLQTLLADRSAAQTYGANIYGGALEQVLRQIVTFNQHVEVAVRQMKTYNWPMPNLFTSPPNLPADALKAIETRLDAIRVRGGGGDASPALDGRLRLIRQQPAQPERPDDARPAWELWADAEHWQERMLTQIRGYARR